MSRVEVAGKKPQKLTAEEVVGGRQLHSKVAVITGASGGLGYETARVLCKVRPLPPCLPRPQAILPGSDLSRLSSSLSSRRSAGGWLAG